MVNLFLLPLLLMGVYDLFVLVDGCAQVVFGTGVAESESSLVFLN